MTNYIFHLKFFYMFHVRLCYMTSALLTSIGYSRFVTAINERRHQYNLKNSGRTVL
jgi:hypothetical protein